MVSVNSPGKTTFVDAVVSGFRNTTNYRGAADRPAFWYWILFLALVRCVTVTIDGFIYPEDLTAEVTGTNWEEILSLLMTQVQHSLLSSTFIVELILLPSTVAVSVRRLRDAGWKPWIAFVAFASNYVGLFLTLVASTQILSVLTVASGPLDPEALVAELAAPTFTIVAIALVNLGTSIATLVGTLQRTATPASI